MRLATSVSLMCLAVGALATASGTGTPSRSTERSLSSRVAAPATSDLSVSDSTVDPDSLCIHAIGRDYYWQFRFAGADGRFNSPDDVHVGSDLHLPLDTPVTFRISTQDNVYVLSVPELGLRRIAVPELTYSLNYRTTIAGRFEVVTDPMCGARLFHDGPMGSIVVQSKKEFQAWFAQMAMESSAPDAITFSD